MNSIDEFYSEFVWKGGKDGRVSLFPEIYDPVTGELCIYTVIQYLGEIIFNIRVHVID